MKNYYAILGVSHDDTPARIRAAYRDAVRRTHPDHAGAEHSADFQEIVEAHSVLSDPVRRRKYNEALGIYKRDRNRPEFLQEFKAASQPPSIFAHSESVYPSFEALAERLLRNFTGRGAPKAEKPQGLGVEVILTPEEAARGGVLCIDIPVQEYCPVCGGTGRDWPFLCSRCAGEGLMSRTQPLQVSIPNSLRFGVTTEVSLEARGINNLSLRLRLRVSNEQFD
jgi:DnaJ-class molecular chaperone